MGRRESAGAGARAVLVLVAASVAACSSTRVLPLAAASARHHVELTSPAGFPVVGYVSSDGARHHLPSFAELSPDGTVTFRSSWVGDEIPDPILRCPPGEVTALIVWRKNPLKEVAGAVGRVVVVGVAIVLVVVVMVVLEKYDEE